MLFESKVLSDISKQVTFDITRNQLARCIDIMLEDNNDLHKALGKRGPENSLFLLLTLEVFRKKPWTRLYGYLMEEYRTNPDTLSRDLMHRDPRVCRSISSRIGWLTFEDIKKTCPNSCHWID